MKQHRNKHHKAQGTFSVFKYEYVQYRVFNFCLNLNTSMAQHSIMQIAQQLKGTTALSPAFALLWSLCFPCRNYICLWIGSCS